MSEAQSIDLYSILGVRRVSTKREIHEAYRAQAKVLHPDVAETGDTHKFSQIKLARDILTNDRHRANYDALGVIEREEADNEVSAQLTTLTGLFGKVMHSLLSHGVPPQQGDFIKAMHAAVTEGFSGVNKQLSAFQASLDALEPMAGRFKVTNTEVPNHMETIVQGQMELMRRQIAQQQVQLRGLETARIYLNNITFLQAPRP